MGAHRAVPYIGRHRAPSYKIQAAAAGCAVAVAFVVTGGIAVTAVEEGQMPKLREHIKLPELLAPDPFAPMFSPFGSSNPSSSESSK